MNGYNPVVILRSGATKDDEGVERRIRDGFLERLKFRCHPEERGDEGS